MSIDAFSIDVKMLRIMESVSACGPARLIEMAFIPYADTPGWMSTGADQMLRNPSYCHSEWLGGCPCVC